MNPQDPESAHRIVAEFAGLHEQHVTGARLPVSVRVLPYPKQTIKEAILTCRRTLQYTEQLTPDLHEMLEEAYVGLSEYIDDELVRVMTEYREAADTLAADARQAREKTQTQAWSRLAETGRLAGNVARAIAEDATALRAEFQDQPLTHQTEASS
jgi:hypothetical protein